MTNHCLKFSHALSLFLLQIHMQGSTLRRFLLCYSCPNPSPFMISGAGVPLGHSDMGCPYRTYRHRALGPPHVSGDTSTSHRPLPLLFPLPFRLTLLYDYLYLAPGTFVYTCLSIHVTYIQVSTNYLNYMC